MGSAVAGTGRWEEEEEEGRESNIIYIGKQSIPIYKLPDEHRPAVSPPSPHRRPVADDARYIRNAFAPRHNANFVIIRFSAFTIYIILCVLRERARACIYLRRWCYNSPPSPSYRHRSHRSHNGKL